MNDYNAVRICANPCTADITDLAAAFLADAGFESFEPDETGLTAYIRATENAAEIAGEALAGFPIETEFSISVDFIEGEDWNSEWEKNYFKPIVIDSLCVVHSSFHSDVPEAQYDIVIDPKMAFGTGHHDTTSQMMRLILRLSLEGKTVTDMGTGTGILAILASMRGAGHVNGIEIDEAAYLNALDHAKLNGTPINIIHGDATALESLAQADFLFANINRNIILADLGRYADALKRGGEMLLSGFYESDVPMIQRACASCGIFMEECLVSGAGWAALRLVKR